MNSKSLNTICQGLLLSAGGLWFWFSHAGSLFDNFLLVRDSAVVKGYITNTWEDGSEDDEGNVDVTQHAEYKFHLPLGQEFVGTASDYSGNIDDEVEVEYYPRDPSINRVKGTGSQTLFEWLWQDVGAGCLMLFLCIYPGFYCFREVWLEIRFAKLLAWANQVDEDVKS